MPGATTISPAQGDIEASLQANGCLQQIAANRFSIPLDVIAILLQGFVRASSVVAAGQAVAQMNVGEQVFRRDYPYGLTLRSLWARFPAAHSAIPPGALHHATRRLLHRLAQLVGRAPNRLRHEGGTLQQGAEHRDRAAPIHSILDPQGVATQPPTR